VEKRLDAVRRFTDEIAKRTLRDSTGQFCTVPEREQSSLKQFLR